MDINKFLLTPEKKKVVKERLGKILKSIKLATLSYSLIEIGEYISKEDLILWRIKILNEMGIKGERSLRQQFHLLNGVWHNPPFKSSIFGEMYDAYDKAIKSTWNPVTKSRLVRGYESEIRYVERENELARQKAYVFGEVKDMIKNEMNVLEQEILRLNELLPNVNDGKEVQNIKDELISLVNKLGYDPCSTLPLGAQMARRRIRLTAVFNKKNNE